MSSTDKERRCLFCKKKLINEKQLVCKRCKLKGKSVGEKVVGVGVVCLTVAGAAAANTKNKD